MEKFIKPSSLFNILENHYIYNDFKKKLDTLKQNVEFSTLFNSYLELCDSEFEANEKIINLFLLSFGEGKKPIKEFSLRHKIQDEESLIKLHALYKSNLDLNSSSSYINQKASIKSILKIDIQLTDLIKRTPVLLISIKLEFSQAYDLKDYELKFNFDTIDNKTTIKEHDIYIPSKGREYNKKDQKIILNKLPIINYYNNKKAVYFNDYKNYSGYEQMLKDLRLNYPELNRLDKKELTSLFLTGKLSNECLELLQLTEDFLLSTSDYVKKDNKTIFDMIKKDNFSVKQIKKLK